MGALGGDRPLPFCMLLLLLPPLLLWVLCCGSFADSAPEGTTQWGRRGFLYGIEDFLRKRPDIHSAYADMFAIHREHSTDVLGPAVTGLGANKIVEAKSKLLFPDTWSPTVREQI